MMTDETGVEYITFSLYLPARNKSMDTVYKESKMPYANQLETNMTSYSGSLEAYVFEATGPGPAYPPTNVIRTDQPWGATVKWEMDGALVTWLNATFQIQVVLERMGPGADYALPIVTVNSLTGILTPIPPKRNYSVNVNVGPGAVVTGIYRVVVALHLFDDGTGNPTPIAGFADCGYIDIFQPA